MQLRNLLIVLLLVLLSFSAIAQPKVSGMSSDEWMKMITANAIKKGEKPHPGYALYFSQAGDIQVPYIVYVPASYDLSRATSVVVFLHGAILARDNFFHHTDPATADEPVFSVGDTYNTIVVFPFSKAGFAWPGQSAACENIATILGQVQQLYNVNKKRIYIGGISMGGIATFWFIANKPDLFAGFYAFSAMPRPADLAHLSKDKPLYSMNAKDDQTFSYSEVQNIYEQHKASVPGWHFNSVESGGHRFIYNPGGTSYVKSLLGNLLKN